MSSSIKAIVNPYAKRTAARSDKIHVEPLPPAAGLSVNEKTDEPPGASSSPQSMTPNEKPNEGAKSPAHFTNSSAARKSPAETASALVIAASDKAGMEGIDRRKIDEIILRVSGNSLYMQQQRKRDEKVNAKIVDLQEGLRLKSAENPSWKSQLEEQIDQEIPSILSQRPSRSICVVVDMDMFYMACEILTRPELVDKPACVGGSMITTSNYVARKYGVRSAMAGYIGDKLVQELSNGQERLIHVPHNFELYQQKSEIVRSVLAEYDPALSAYSLDEAYLNVESYLAYKLQHPDWDHDQIKASVLADHAIQTDDTHLDYNEKKLTSAEEILCRHSPSVCVQLVEAVVRELRDRVFRETGGLTCSAGVAPNFMLAKIASDRNKPNGQLVVGSHHDQIIEFLHPLPARKVSGIGRVQEKILSSFSIVTVQDLYEQRALVRLLFSPQTADFLVRASVGCSSSSTSSSSSTEESGQKGISRERTFQPGHSWSEINSRLEDIGRLLSEDMTQKNLSARTVTVKVKLHTYDILSKSRSMPASVYVQASNDLVRVATELLNDIRNDHKGTLFSVRLLGIRCSNFGSTNSEAALYHPSRDDPSVTVPARLPLVTLDRFLQKKGKSTADCLKTEELQDAELDRGIDNPLPPRVSFSDDDPNTRVTSTSASDSQAGTSISLQHVLCPLCGRTFREEQNLALNQHIDACLSGAIVRRAVREESLRPVDSEPPRKKKKQSIEDFFSFRD